MWTPTDGNHSRSCFSRSTTALFEQSAGFSRCSKAHRPSWWRAPSWTRHMMASCVAMQPTIPAHSIVECGGVFLPSPCAQGLGEYLCRRYNVYTCITCTYYNTETKISFILAVRAICKHGSKNIKPAVVEKLQKAPPIQESGK